MPEFLRNNCVTMKEFEKIIILHVGSFGSGEKNKNRWGPSHFLGFSWMVQTLAFMVHSGP